MKIEFSSVCNKTPFKYMVMNSPWTNKPAFWVNPNLAYNPKSKATATGLVFTDKEVVLELTCRFIAQQCHAWPGLAEKYKEFVGGLG